MAAAVRGATSSLSPPCYFSSLEIWFGWHTLFDENIYAVWLFNYLLAFILGIVFQYFTIVSMRGLFPGKGLVQAAKADILSLSAWQVGM